MTIQQPRRPLPSAFPPLVFASPDMAHARPPWFHWVNFVGKIYRKAWFYKDWVVLAKYPFNS